MILLRPEVLLIGCVPSVVGHVSEIGILLEYDVDVSCSNRYSTLCSVCGARACLYGTDTVVQIVRTWISDLDYKRPSKRLHYSFCYALAHVTYYLRA